MAVRGTVKVRHHCDKTTICGGFVLQPRYHRPVLVAYFCLSSVADGVALVGTTIAPMIRCMSVTCKRTSCLSS